MVCSNCLRSHLEVVVQTPVGRNHNPIPHFWRNNPRKAEEWKKEQEEYSIGGDLPYCKRHEQARWPTTYQTLPNLHKQSRPNRSADTNELDVSGLELSVGIVCRYSEAGIMAVDAPDDSEALGAGGSATRVWIDRVFLGVEGFGEYGRCQGR